jgi:hypothetical protein
MSKPTPRTEAELVELVRSIDVPAPDSLHREVEKLIAGRSAAGRRRSSRARGPRDRVAGGRRDRPFAARRSSFAHRLAAAGALAAVAAAALVVGLSSGGRATLTLSQAAALTLRPATASAPAQSKSSPAELAAAVDGVAFPYWEDTFGWRSVGARSDRIDGRTVETVFYADARGKRIGYAIVAGTPAPPARGGTISWRAGVPYRLLTENGATVITWLREGRLCVASGRGVDSATLLRLASWSDHTAPV